MLQSNEIKLALRDIQLNTKNWLRSGHRRSPCPVCRCKDVIKWLMSLIFLERLFAFCNHGNEKDVICASYHSWTNHFQQENKCWLLTTQKRIYLQHTKTTSWITPPWCGTDCSGCGCDSAPRNTNWLRPLAKIISGIWRRIQVLPRLTGVKGVRRLELIFISYKIKKRRKKLNWKI